MLFVEGVCFGCGVGIFVQECVVEACVVWDWMEGRRRGSGVYVRSGCEQEVRGARGRREKREEKEREGGGVGEGRRGWRGFVVCGLEVCVLF